MFSRIFNLPLKEWCPKNLKSKFFCERFVGLWNVTLHNDIVFEWKAELRCINTFNAVQIIQTFYLCTFFLVQIFFRGWRYRDRSMKDKSTKFVCVVWWKKDWLTIYLSLFACNRNFYVSFFNNVKIIHYSF